MSPTKKRLQCELSEADLVLPGWDTQQHHSFFEGIKVHGLKKLKRLQRFVGTKTQEDVRIAVELYKKELKNSELLNTIERQIENAGVSNEDYNTWLNLNMASMNFNAAADIPVAILEPQVSPLPPDYDLSFPNWRNADIQDFLATNELAKIIKDISTHIPTKTELEIKAATDALNIICNTFNGALKHGRRFPTYDELKPGYIYLQCVVAALKDNEKLKNLKIAPNADPDMARAEFVLKEWLMPNVGTLPKGWTKDEKYALIVAIEKYGKTDISSIESYLKRSELKKVISAYLLEVECKKASLDKSLFARCLSLSSWGNTLPLCKENTEKILAGKRLICALEELPAPKTKLNLMNLRMKNLTEEELTIAAVNVWMQVNKRRSTLLIPELKEFVREAQVALCKEIHQSLMKT